jgi:hypothetical protein
MSYKTCRDPLTGRRVPCIPTQSLQKVDTSGRVEQPLPLPRSYGRQGARLYFASELPWTRLEGKKLVFTETPGVVSSAGGKIRIER